MKQGWEIKKLGEVCDIINGRNQKKVENPNGKYPIYGSGGIMGYADDFLCRAGTTIIGRKGSINKPLYVDADFWNVDTAFGIQPKCCVDRFIYYLCKSIDFTLYDKGVTIPSLVKSDLLQIPIPVPERAEQERIVGELDCLSGIIAAKRAQLRELDTLAQSIFYTMFGDPITNDKGWSVKQLKDVSTLINGRAYKQEELLSEGKYKVIRVGNFFTNGDYYYSDLELDDDKYCDIGDLLFAWAASFGAFIWNGGKVIYHYHIWKVLFDERKLNIQYYRYILNVMTNDFMKDVHGIGMFHLTKAGMEQYKLPIPPLSLQNEFAEKIENIERQKELITKSIIETEDLFNSRMSYYFD